MLRWFVTITLLASSLGSLRGAEPSLAADELLKKRFPANKPGAAVLIVHNGQPVLMNGYGLSDLKAKTTITADTAFDLASVSKQFTATAIMMLAERGKLGYDDPLQKWIPEMPAFDSPRPVTLRDLLCHTSGLIDYLSLFKGDDDDFSKLTCFDIAPMFKGRKLRNPPGTKFEYSNSNYALLPVIVERASGKSFSAFMKDYVFLPLAMNHTQVMDKFPYDVENRATGYARKLMIGKHEVSRRDGPVCGDGNVFCTARDFIRWDAGLAEHRLVRPQTQDLAWTSGKLDNGKETGYGFGWMVHEKDGRKFVEHSGGWSGARTFIGRWLADKLTIVVLSNDESVSPGDVADDLAKLFLPARQPSSGPDASSSGQPASKKD